MRKSLFLLLLLTALPLTAAAEEFSTVHRDDSWGPQSTYRGYFAPIAKTSNIEDTAGLLLGARGGWLLGRHWLLGAAIYGLATHQSIPAANGQRLSFGYGGGFFEYVLGSGAPVSVSLSTMIGGGGIGSMNGGPGHAVFVIEPELDVTFGLSRSLRAGMGLSYRATGQTRLANLTREDLSGIAATLLVEFGAFD